MADDEDMLRYQRPKRLKFFAILIVALAVCIVGYGIVSRSLASSNLRAATDAQALPTVNIVTPSGGGERHLVLPGDIRAFNEAPIYAQVSGYLQNFYADIGTQVHQGQLLGLIDTPDLDQQLVQAKADLATAAANEQLEAVTAKRWKALLAQDAVSQQDEDDKQGALQAGIAQVDAAQANVQRLQAMEVFKRIVAPFDGVVTSRATDIGALISVGSPAQVPLFTVDDEHRLRIYVNVPQNYSAEIKPGMTARFTVPEYPNHEFTAVLVSTARAIDTSTGTLLVQFQMDNSGAKLQPGDYAQVHFDLPADQGAIIIPASALMFRDSGMQVATVDANHRVTIKNVSLGRDFGTTVEITDGLSKTARIINDPPDVLQSGDTVQLAKPAAHASPGSHPANP
jgi:RND family efflux transporter MFP subunit